MKANNIKALLMVLLGSGMVFAVHTSRVYSYSKSETQVRDVRVDSTGKRTAIVQLEVDSAPAFVDDAVYAVRLMGSTQKNARGDLVMNVEAGSDPPPSVKWTDGKLVVTLFDQQKYRFFATPVDGTDVVIEQK